MSDVSDLLSRIDSEFASMDKAIKDFQQENVRAHQAREQRIEQFQIVCDQLKAVWKPREEWTYSLENIDHFEPTGEPDADYESYRHHL